MSEEIMIFRRTEKKYLLDEYAYQKLMHRIHHHLAPDPHGRSTVCNLYLDTEDYRMIRTSIDATLYKEKLRLRSYGIPTGEDPVFFEIKKKYRGVVYKRRAPMSYADALCFAETGRAPFDSQIVRELSYALKIWEHPKPRTLLAYERDAFYEKEDSTLRVTFDRGVRYRRTDEGFGGSSEGKTVLAEGLVLMEIKTALGMPLWLSRALSSLSIYPSRYSKYANAYHDIFKEER